MWERVTACTMALALVLSAGTAQTGAASKDGATAPQPNEAAEESLVGRMVLVKTAGGGEFQGKVLAAADDRLELIDGEGRIIPIFRPAIVSVSVVRPSGKTGSERDLFFRDAAANRFIVMPTAFPIEPGELHITTQEVVVITMSYGVTPRVSAWGGISIPGAVANLRCSFQPTDRAAVSIGSFAGMTWTFPRTAAVLPYAIVSFGVPDRNFTAALALPAVVSETESPYTAGALAAFGWKTIVSRTASVITETWIFLNSDGGRWVSVDVVAVPAVAFRIAGGRFSWDIGAFLPTQFASLDTGYAFTGIAAGPFIPLPILSLTYRLR